VRFSTEHQQRFAIYTPVENVEKSQFCYKHRLKKLENLIFAKNTGSFP